MHIADRGIYLTLYSCKPCNVIVEVERDPDERQP
jgi:hypothetical protein